MDNTLIQIIWLLMAECLKEKLVPSSNRLLQLYITVIRGMLYIVI